MPAMNFTSVNEARAHLEARGWRRVSARTVSRDLTYERGRETMMILPATDDGWPAGMDPHQAPCRLFRIDLPPAPHEGAELIWRVGDRHGLNATFHRTEDGAVAAALERLALGRAGGRDAAEVAGRRQRLMDELRATGTASLGHGMLRVSITAVELGE
jgi:hypothetical protein